MSSSRTYRHNHYVPVWYQRRFLPAGQSTWSYLDLRPDAVVNNGHRYMRRALRWLGPDNCFAQDDLYTTKWGALENTEIEQFFFGRIDAEGQGAVDYFASFQHPDVNGDAYQSLMTYMTVQKLRTPKGLRWLAQVSNEQNHNLNLIFLQSVQNMFGAIWTESVWQLADADKSPVKFIISDQPVVVYNRACFPGSRYCTGFNDPDIRFVASHTYFPLSLNRVLILTNLAWVRNPYQSELKFRPNPSFFRGSIFNFTDIHTYRNLSENEVLQINYITKRRAFRYIAAAEEEWLYPEKHLDSTQWNKLGGGYLLMPDPRDVHIGGEVMVRYENGGFDAWSEYGHKPWQRDYGDKERRAEESKALLRFQAEFAATYGPAWRGNSHSFNLTGPHVDSEESHNRYLELNRRLRDGKQARHPR